MTDNPMTGFTYRGVFIQRVESLIGGTVYEAEVNGETVVRETLYGIRDVVDEAMEENP